MTAVSKVTATLNADLRTDDFDFDLPTENIAKEPARPRGSARMLEVEHHLNDLNVADLPRILNSGDTLVLNNTRVIPARLRGTRRGVKIEVTLHKAVTGGLWHAFARPARKLSQGDVICFATDFEAHVCEKGEGGEVLLSFRGSRDFRMALAEHGEMPLPPYIHRSDGAIEADKEDYQTVYGTREGAVAAPTAGLHFSEALLEEIRGVGVKIEMVTLHVGAGTFLPVKTDRIAHHRMHSEWGEIAPHVAARINATRETGNRVVAAGTTVLRLLEAAAETGGRLKPFCGDTDIFITPGYRFRVVDALLTNFHLPRSTLFMLVAAFSGLERMKAAYAHAIGEGYRFYSYGDSSFLHRLDGP